jgi:hypothetical protein
VLKYGNFLNEKKCLEFIEIIILMILLQCSKNSENEHIRKYDTSLINKNLLSFSINIDSLLKTFYVFSKYSSN